jgi:hypothetical protein
VLLGYRGTHGQIITIVEMNGTIVFSQKIEIAARSLEQLKAVRD